jgi:ribonucleoside-diphosphate reductase alpha chain
MAKEGSTIGGLMDTIGTLTSLALQYGVPLEALVNKFTHMRFEPSGWTGNPDIPMAKSITDYIFRWLGIQFLPGYREANTPKREPEAGHGTGDDSAEAEPTATARGSAVAEEHPKTAAAIVRSLTDLANGQKHGNGKVPSLNPQLSSLNSRSAQFATFQADAPACDNCGAITVRNGNCYLCHNCGNSMGCS